MGYCIESVIAFCWLAFQRTITQTVSSYIEDSRLLLHPSFKSVCDILCIFILVIPRYWKKLLFIYSQCQSVIRLVSWIIWIIIAVNWTKLTACLTDVYSMPSVPAWMLCIFTNMNNWMCIVYVGLKVGEEQNAIFCFKAALQLPLAKSRKIRHFYRTSIPRAVSLRLSWLFTLTLFGGRF